MLCAQWSELCCEVGSHWGLYISCDMVLLDDVLVRSVSLVCIVCIVCAMCGVKSNYYPLYPSQIQIYMQCTPDN
jgi:hypothetical protein